MYRGVAWTLVVVANVLILGDRSVAVGQDGVSERPYSGRDASAEAYYRAETKRRAEVAQHVGTIEYVRWLTGRGVPTSIPTLYPADRDTYYAFGGRSDYSQQQRVFELWPYLPGDVWGFSSGPRAASLAPQRGPAIPPTGRSSHAVRDATADAAEAIGPGPVSY